MSKTIAAITDSSTFSVWKQQSNDLASHAAKAVTMTSTGTPGDNNEGNISLNGNLALEAGHTITVDTITGNSTAIELQKNLRIDGVGATSLTFSLNDTPKWILQTSAGHGYFEVSRGNRFFRITSDGSSTGAITGSGLTLNKELLPASIDAATTGNAATATLATKVTVTDNTANTDFPVVFHNESSANSLLDDTGTFEYNPSSGTITTTKLTATGAVTAASLDINGDADISGNITMSGSNKTVDGVDISDLNTKLSAAKDNLDDARVTAILQAVYPVGSIYISVLGTDPSVLFGFGSWSRYAKGRTLLGVVDPDGLDTSSFVKFCKPGESGSTGGWVEESSQSSVRIQLFSGSADDDAISVGDVVTLSGFTSNLPNGVTIDGNRTVKSVNGEYIWTNISGQVSTTELRGTVGGTGATVKITKLASPQFMGGHNNHRLTKDEIQHVHITGAYVGTGNDDCHFPMMRDLQQDPSVGYANGTLNPSLQEYGFSQHTFGQNIGNLEFKGREIAGARNLNRIRDVAASLADVKGIVTMPVHHQGMMQNDPTEILPPYITTYMWRRDS